MGVPNGGLMDAGWGIREILRAEPTEWVVGGLVGSCR